MKIALLSFHNAANYGAALQAYALQQAIEQMGHDCEYIDYLNHERRNHYSLSYLFWDALKKGKFADAAKYIAGAPFLLTRKMRFNKFYKSYLHVTKETYRNTQEAAALNPYYDRFIVGSDQVWNPDNNGDDAAFLLDFVEDDKKKISYSSSFGIASIDEGHRDVFKKNLKKFKALAVRESIGRDIIMDLTGREAQVVLDPVMLLSKDQWMSIVSNRVKREEYIFSYTNRDSQIADFFKTGYKLYGKKHYVLSRYTRPQDFMSRIVRVKYWMSPQEFVSVIANAELVVSASFHCLAMSIILNRPFIAILTGDKGKDERPLNILRALNLESRILKPNMTPSDILSPIDWKSVNGRVEELKKESLEYLIKSIGD